MRSKKLAAMFRFSLLELLIGMTLLSGFSAINAIEMERNAMMTKGGRTFVLFERQGRGWPLYYQIKYINYEETYGPVFYIRLLLDCIVALASVALCLFLRCRFIHKRSEQD